MWRNPPEIIFCKMTCILIFLCMAVLPFAQCTKIHEHMTKEEMLSVFHTTDPEEYEVVPILHTVHRRSPEAKQEVHLKAFGKDYYLSLKSNDGLWAGKEVPMWTVDRNSSESDGLLYEKVPDEETYVGNIYQDQENMAAVLLHRDSSGKVLVDGSIGENLVIRPLPERVVKEIVNKKDELHQPHLLPKQIRKKRDLDQTSHHVVYKRSAQPQDLEYSDFAYMEPDHISKRFRSKRSTENSRSKREAPYVIYPEILCIVDYDGYRLHGGDNVQIKRYFVSFWNGVDLRYKLLKGPKIRISIAGIIISRGRDATPYLERNRVGRDAIDSAAALTDMGKYLFRERRLPVYDIAVAVTKLDMCRRQYANEVCNRGTAGFAYVGGACVVNKRLEKVNSVAIIEDTGGFSGIIVAAHEVGHLLGAVHDGSPPPSYLGGPGAEKCRWEDGYIMSDLRHTEKGFRWSHCSVSSFHHFLNGDTATCLYNAPHEDEALPRVLPGKLLSLDAQCRKDRGTSACFKDDRVCAQLFCFDAGSGYCVAYRPAAEGSPCGDGQYCLNGKCVAEHENIIPDYTQNLPTYVRRDNIYSPSTQSRPIYARYNTTDYRNPWDGTTRSIYESQYESDHSVSSTSTTMSTSTTTEPQYTTASVPYSRYTYSTVSNSITDDGLNNKKYSSYSNNYNKQNSHGTSTTSTTKKTPNPYGYSYTYKTNNNEAPNVNNQGLTYRYQKPGNSFLISTTTKSIQLAPQYNYPHETEDGECQDTGTDCAELIDRLKTWLCHLKSVKSRCCASLKTIC